MIKVNNENELKEFLKSCIAEGMTQVVFTTGDFAVETAAKIFMSPTLLERMKACAFDQFKVSAIKPIVEEASRFSGEAVTITVCSDVVQCLALLMKNVKEMTYDHEGNKFSATL